MQSIHKKSVRAMNKRLKIFVIAFSIWLVAINVFGSDRPIGQNCEISKPPNDSGEDSHMYAGAFKIFPRAKHIDPNYSGCQIIWVSKSESLENWELMAILSLENGKLIGSWSPKEIGASFNECKYVDGKLVSGDNNRCYQSEAVPLKSMRPGCLSDLLKASYDKTMPLPKDCFNYE
ncbi:MAG: hypothetical protein KDJ38_02940 [Gammaproteobacteria bacterium]|nr:hypothetical protein [Gammaproteobacteria bacterium]